MRKWMTLCMALCLSIGLLVSGCAANHKAESASQGPVQQQTQQVTLDSIPVYEGKPYVVLNHNKPNFTEQEKNTKAVERYSPLDSLGRCGPAFANIGRELMPTKKRGPIGQVKPSGWQIAKYDSVDGKYLYNRCHLIGYQLTGENANERNLITGTRYMNVDGMLPFENMVADYVKETGNHVLYRVTPIFKSGELVARGVQMEALSIEDHGAGIMFNVYCYNNQPGIVIDYKTGKSHSDPNSTFVSKTKKNTHGKEVKEYVINTNTKKFHLPDCTSAKKMKEKYKKDYTGTRESLLEDGYEPCGICKA